MADDKMTEPLTGKTKAAAPADQRADPPPDEAADVTEAVDDQAAKPVPEAANDRGVEDDVGDLRSKLLSTLADMENLRRRTEREIADTRRYAVASFAREMLTVGDNLRRAIEAVTDEMRDGGDKSVAALIEGVEVTERTLAQTLTKIGVKRIDTKGQKFDPSLHQAMMEVDHDAAEPGSVADEIQVGYVIGDRVLRPAFVSVVKKRRSDSETPREAPAEAATTAPEAPEAPAEDAGKA